MSDVLKNHITVHDVLKISILVIGFHKYIKIFKENFFEMCRLKNYGQKYKCITCESVTDILQFTDREHIDYCVFLFDPAQKTSLDEIQINMKNLDKAFLCGRTCFVNCRNDQCYSDCLFLNEILKLKRTLKIPLINGNIMDSTSASRLTDQILRLAKSHVGKTIPIVPWIMNR